jgi:hydroxymethylbilane synthase
VRRTLRIGTRGSELAIWQARHVAGLLSALDGAPGELSHLTVEIVEIRTEGDQVLDRPLSQVEGKAFFTREIEEALAAGTVDLAVHSLKDLPTALPDGLAIGAVLERGDPRDVWLSRAGAGFAALAAGARIGTSSLRRRALVARWRPELELVDLRGNVPTRVRRLEEGRYDAIVLAAAGVERLGLERHVTEWLPLAKFLPAVAQGAIAVEIRAGDEATAAWVNRLDHEPTRFATDAERALLAALEGGCQVPVGALATVEGTELRLAAEVLSIDGRRRVAGERRGSTSRAGEIGRELAAELIENGAAAILAEARRVVSAS